MRSWSVVFLCFSCPSHCHLLPIPMMMISRTMEYSFSQPSAFSNAEIVFSFSLSLAISSVNIVAFSPLAFLKAVTAVPYTLLFISLSLLSPDSPLDFLFPAVKLVLYMCVCTSLYTHTDTYINTYIYTYCP